MELDPGNNSSVYNFEVDPEFLGDLCTPGLVITFIELLRTMCC